MIWDKLVRKVRVYDCVVRLLLNRIAMMAKIFCLLHQPFSKIYLKKEVKRGQSLHFKYHYRQSHYDCGI